MGSEGHTALTRRPFDSHDWAGLFEAASEGFSVFGFAVFSNVSF